MKVLGPFYPRLQEFYQANYIFWHPAMIADKRHREEDDVPDAVKWMKSEDLRLGRLKTIVGPGHLPFRAQHNPSRITSRSLRNLHMVREDCVYP